MARSRKVLPVVIRSLGLPALFPWFYCFPLPTRCFQTPPTDAPLHLLLLQNPCQLAAGCPAGQPPTQLPTPQTGFSLFWHKGNRVRCAVPTACGDIVWHTVGAEEAWKPPCAPGSQGPSSAPPPITVLGPLQHLSLITSVARGHCPQSWDRQVASAPERRSWGETLSGCPVSTEAPCSGHCSVLGTLPEPGAWGSGV